jgi:hypothetical protein
VYVLFGVFVSFIFLSFLLCVCCFVIVKVERWFGGWMGEDGWMGGG